MKITRKQLRKMILKEMAGMTDLRSSSQGYLEVNLVPAEKPFDSFGKYTITGNVKGHEVSISSEALSDISGFTRGDGAEGIFKAFNAKYGSLPPHDFLDGVEINVKIIDDEGAYLVRETRSNK